MDEGLLPGERKCPVSNCGHPMRLHQSSAYPDGCYWYYGHVNKKNKKRCKKKPQCSDWNLVFPISPFSCKNSKSNHASWQIIPTNRFFLCRYRLHKHFFGGAAHHLIKSSKIYKLTTGKPLLIGTGRVGKQPLSCVLFFPSLLAGLALLSRSMNRCLANVSYFTLTSTFIKVNYLNFFFLAGKYNRGKMRKGVWVFGGAERGSNRCFLVPVKTGRRPL